MANFDTIKTTIDANINTNGNQAITGAVMNSVLKQMVDSTDAELTELDQVVYKAHTRTITHHYSSAGERFDLYINQGKTILSNIPLRCYYDGSNYEQVPQNLLYTFQHNITNGIYNMVSGAAMLEMTLYGEDEEIKNTLADVESLTNKISNNVVSATYINLLTDVTNDSLLNNQGQIIPNSHGWKVKDYIDCSDALSISITHNLADANRPRIATYMSKDESSFIRSILVDSGEKLIFAENEKFVRFSFLPNYVSSAQIYIAESPLITTMRSNILANIKDGINLNGWNKNRDTYENVGNGNVLSLTNEVELRIRKYIADFSCSGGVVSVGCGDGSNSYGSVVCLDYVNKKLSIKKYVGAPTFLVTDEDFVFETFSENLTNKKVRLSITVNNMVVSVKLFNLENAAEIVSFVATPTNPTTPETGFWYNRFGISSNANIVLYDLFVYTDIIKDLPVVWIAGDSITEGVGGTGLNDSWAVRAVNAIGSGFVSGQAGGTIVGVLNKINSELVKIKPMYAIVQIGTNGGNTIANLTDMCNRIKNIGTIPILSVPPLRREGETGIPSMQQMILDVANALGVTTIRMDIALANNRNVNDGANPLLYADPAHPNSAGYLAMFNQMKLDCPFLFD